MFDPGVSRDDTHLALSFGCLETCWTSTIESLEPRAGYRTSISQLSNAPPLYDSLQSWISILMILVLDLLPQNWDQRWQESVCVKELCKQIISGVYVCEVYPVVGEFWNSCWNENRSNVYIILPDLRDQPDTLAFLNHIHRWGHFSVNF